MPAVSVVMAAYNVAPYIGDAIESVLHQTYGDLELLVVDDGATDATAAIAAAYARRDPRVRVITQANAGISAARNQGLRVATSPLIAILDSDDIWEPSYLEAQVRILNEQPEVDIVTGNGWFLGGRLNGSPARPWPDHRPSPTLAGMIADETAVFIMSVFRRRVYEAIGPFDEKLRTNEDYDFWLRAACHGFVFARNDRPLGHYRRREDSLSSDELRMLPGILTVFRKLRPHLLNQSSELALLDAQIARFEIEHLAAKARGAIESRDYAAARYHLSNLHDRSGGAILRAAEILARWTPALLSIIYNNRRTRVSRAARYWTTL